MKKNYTILILLILFCCNSVGAQGVKVTGSIVPNALTDGYPTHTDIYGKGGFMSVKDVATRDNINALRRKLGMLVYVTDNDVLYQLKGGEENTNWVAVSLGANGGSFIWGGSRTSDPASPAANTVYFNTATKKTYIWNGTTNTWEILAEASIINWKPNATAHPDPAVVNDAYYNTSQKKSFIYDGANWQMLAQDGSDGAQGSQGPQGIQGIQGPAGANGTSIIWRNETSAPLNPETNWAYYNVVDKKSYIYNGNEWKILSQDGAVGVQGPPGNAGVQGLQGVQGPAGANGTSIIWRNETSTPLNPETNWAYYNVVDKKSYIYNNNEWKILSQDGSDGAQGTQGPQGIQGVQGPAGTNGTSIIWRNETSAPLNPEPNWAYYNVTDKKSYIYNGSEWKILAKDGADGSGSSSTFNGTRPITGSIFTNQNPGTNDIAAWLEYLFYPSQTPTATLSMTYGGNTQTSFILERMADGAALSATLNWGAGRQATTATLSTVSVAGQAQTFSQPAQGALVTGTQSVSLTRNTNTTLSNIVLTSDSKSAQANVSVSFSYRRYIGFVTQPGGVSEGQGFTPTPAEILALTGQPFASSRGFTSSVTPSGAQRLVIAYPVAWDPGPTTPAQISVDGFVINSDGFTRQVISFTNASGAVADYVVYARNINTNSQISVTVQ